MFPQWPRFLPVRDDGRLMMREVFSRRSSLGGTLWLLVCVTTLMVYIAIMANTLTTSSLRPYLSVSWVYGLWVMLSLALTAVTMVALSHVVRKVGSALGMR